MNYTEPAKEVLKKAEKIARELDHPYVGTEHLLLAFMRVCTGVAGQILSANGVEEANLYKIVDELISPVGEVTFQEKPKRSPRLEYTLEESKEEAIRFQSEAIGTEHMLLAILREPDSVSYLESVKGEIDEVIQVQHVAARVSAGCFAIVIRDYVDRGSLVDLMCALELALLWKVRIDGRKTFCAVRSAAVRFPEDGDDPVALVERTVSLLERDRPGR